MLKALDTLLGCKFLENEHSNRDEIKSRVELGTISTIPGIFMAMFNLTRPQLANYDYFSRALNPALRKHCQIQKIRVETSREPTTRAEREKH